MNWVCWRCDNDWLLWQGWWVQDIIWCVLKQNSLRRTLEGRKIAAARAVIESCLELLIITVNARRARSTKLIRRSDIITRRARSLARECGAYLSVANTQTELSLPNIYLVAQCTGHSRRGGLLQIALLLSLPMGRTRSRAGLCIFIYAMSLNFVRFAG